MHNLRFLNFFIFFVILEVVVSLTNETVHHDLPNAIAEVQDTRRAKKKHQSTSSSSDARGDSSKSGESLSDSVSMTSTSSEKKKKDKPQNSAERMGWRKWHRKCPPCPNDMRKKWRDPSIKWICGAYQRARRSFKSECMMYYRNCQDGTMFVKIHDHRCENDTTPTKRYGTHFFYEYKVVLSDESAKTDSSTSEEKEEEDSW